MSRLASPKLALLIGALGLLLMIGGVVSSAPAHQLSFSGNAEGALVYGAFLIVGTAVAFKRPRNRMGWMLLGVAVFGALQLVGSSYSIIDYTQHGGRLPLGALAVLIDPSWAPAIVLMGLSIVLYPDGHAPSRRWVWPLRGLCALGALWVFGAFGVTANAVLSGAIRLDSSATSSGDQYALVHPTGAWAWWATVQIVWFCALIGVCAAWILSQLLSYRVLTGDRRLQQKWIISGATLFLLGGAASVFLSGPGNAASRAGVALGLVALIGLPASIGVGILKYRLYEIDRLVSRTLSYAILTALLAATFVTLILLSTRLLPFSSSVGVAASTLVAAALFDPLRKRVQNVVDRRFNRARYDAEATVEAFAARLRDAVDLDMVQAELLEAVKRAVEPAHATIWIRPSGQG